MEPSGYADALSSELDAVFAALADPTRRSILERLAEGEATVTELAAPLDISQPAVSKHLKVLERAGLVSVSRDGTSRPRRLEPARLARADAWLERYRRYWEASFAKLDDLLLELRERRSS